MKIRILFRVHDFPLDPIEKDADVSDLAGAIHAAEEECISGTVAEILNEDEDDTVMAIRFVITATGRTSGTVKVFLEFWAFTFFQAEQKFREAVIQAPAGARYALIGMTGELAASA